MTGLLFLSILMIASMALLMREALVIAGVLKGPILHEYEKYGDEEPFYYPFPRILFLLGLFSAGLGAWISAYVRAWCLPLGPAALLCLLGWVALDRKETARRHPELFQVFPRWCGVLREYTTREERRRIAYLWLDLPLKTRLLYNSSDRAFLHWADFIVLATA